MQAYAEWVSRNLLLSAAIQFGILGTLGEIISIYIKRSKISTMGNPIQFILKILAWAVMGIVIKYGFTGMKGFTDTLISKGLLFNMKHGTLAWAFFMSLFTNLFFGPQMMLFHRLEENFIMWKWSFSGIKNAWFTLIWFWIPAHTLTFMLPAEYQIGLAALWSVALGIIMGISSQKS